MNNINQKIPEGWSVKKISDLGNVVSGGTPDTNNPEYWDGNVLWVTPSEVSTLSNRFISNTERKITEKGLKESSAKLLPINSLIICTRATIGDCCINKVPMCTNQGFKNIIVKNNNVDFLYYLITKNKNELIRKACGSTFLEISKKDIDNLKFAIPPLPEQEKIARILGTWDEAIEKLSSLIEQKKNLKKGLMQRLLTGKTRLNGFTQPWNSILIRDFCNIKRGGSPRPIDDYLTSSNDGLNWLKIGDISSDAKYIYQTENKIKTEGLSKTTLVHSGDFILSNSMSFGRPYIMKIDACIHDGWLALTSIKKDVSKEFLFYLLSFSETQKKFNMCAAGSGVRNLNKDIVGEVKIQLPPYYEQKAIADVLSTADEEIDLLNKKLEALKEQKKGLMQQLLTGQTRVKVN